MHVACVQPSKPLTELNYCCCFAASLCAFGSSEGGAASGDGAGTSGGGPSGGTGPSGGEDLVAGGATANDGAEMAAAGNATLEQNVQQPTAVQDVAGHMDHAAGPAAAMPRGQGPTVMTKVRGLGTLYQLQGHLGH